MAEGGAIRSCGKNVSSLSANVPAAFLYLAFRQAPTYMANQTYAKLLDCLFASSGNATHSLFFRNLQQMRPDHGGAKH